MTFILNYTSLLNVHFSQTLLVAVVIGSVSGILTFSLQSYGKACHNLFAGTPVQIARLKIEKANKEPSGVVEVIDDFAKFMSRVDRGMSREEFEHLDPILDYIFGELINEWILAPFTRPETDYFVEGQPALSPKDRKSPFPVPQVEKAFIHLLISIYKIEMFEGSGSRILTRRFWRTLLSSN